MTKASVFLFASFFMQFNLTDEQYLTLIFNLGVAAGCLHAQKETGLANLNLQIMNTLTLQRNAQPGQQPETTSLTE